MAYPDVSEDDRKDASPYPLWELAWGMQITEELLDKIRRIYYSDSYGATKGNVIAAVAFDCEIRRSILAEWLQLAAVQPEYLPETMHEYSIRLEAELPTAVDLGLPAGTSGDTLLYARMEKLDIVEALVLALSYGLDHIPAKEGV